MAKTDTSELAHRVVLEIGQSRDTLAVEPNLDCAQLQAEFAAMRYFNDGHLPNGCLVTTVKQQRNGDYRIGLDDGGPAYVRIKLAE